MLNPINDLDTLTITAYHEAGHAVVATLLGQPISSLNLLYRKQGKDWVGSTPTDPSDSAAQEIIPYLNASALSTFAQLYPNDKYKSVRILCTIKCAGLIVEQRMGIDVSLEKLGGNQEDIANALRLLESQAFSTENQLKEIYEAKTCAEKILSNNVCWNMIVNLANSIIEAIQEGQELRDSNEYRDLYKFGRDKVYASFIYTLAQEVLGAPNNCK